MNERRQERKEERKAKLSLEKKKLSEMQSFKDRKDYIWEYYKLHIISVILLIIFTGYIVDTTIINPADETGVGLIITSGTLADSEILRTNAGAAIDIQEGYEVTVTSLALGSSQDITFEQTMQQKLLAMLISGEVDLVIGVEELFTENSTSALFGDISLILTDPKYEILKDKFIIGLIPVDMVDPSTILEEEEKFTFKDTTAEDIVCVKRPIGIKIDDCKVLEDLGFNTEGSIIGFSSTGKRLEITLALLDYLLDIK